MQSCVGGGIDHLDHVGDLAVAGADALQHGALAHAPVGAQAPEE